MLALFWSAVLFIQKCLSGLPKLMLNILPWILSLKKFPAMIYIFMIGGVVLITFLIDKLANFVSYIPNLLGPNISSWFGVNGVLDFGIFADSAAFAFYVMGSVFPVDTFIACAIQVAVFEMLIWIWYQYTRFIPTA